MQLTEKKEFAIKLFCLIIIIFLNLAIWINGKDLSCDKCIVNFNSRKNVDFFDLSKNDFNISVIELYNSYLENKCIVEYQEGQGFIYYDN